MKTEDQLDQRIDAHLKDKQTEPSPDFTANVLDRMSQERTSGEPSSDQRHAWWFALPVAAAITFFLFLPNNDSVNTGDPAVKTALSPTNEIDSLDPGDLALAEMEEIFVMEDSLRDFEILFGEDTLEILALLDE